MTSDTSTIGTDTDAALRVLAATSSARAVVMVGVGSGAAGRSLLHGMHPEGILTAVDVDPDHHRSAREAFAADGVAANRTRLITGRPLEVLPRLNDGAYDLVFCPEPAGGQDYLREALRLLRRGGLAVFAGALAGGRVDDPACRDPETVAIRGLVRAVREDESLVRALLPLGGGLLCAVKRG